MRYRIAAGLLAGMFTLSTPVYSQQSRYFGGYRCTDKCRDHAAGFDYARQLRLRDPTQCAGPTLSYEQGCKAYTRDRMRDGKKDDAGRPID